MIMKEGGISFNRVHGMHVFELPRIDSRFIDVLIKATVNSTNIHTKRILDCYQGFTHESALH